MAGWDGEWTLWVAPCAVSGGGVSAPGGGAAGALAPGGGGAAGAGVWGAGREVAAELALHFQRGQDAWRAVQYREQAAENAAAAARLPRGASRSSPRALTLLATLPETPARAQQELALQLALGLALIAIKGQAAPEVEQTYARVRALCAQVGETPQVVQMLRGLLVPFDPGGVVHGAGTGGTARAAGAAHGQATDLLTAHSALGFTVFLLGDYDAAQTHCAQGIAQLDPSTQRAQAVRHGYAPGVFCLSTAANTLWCLGFPAQAGQRSQEALALAQALKHPHSLAFAHLWRLPTSAPPRGAGGPGPGRRPADPGDGAGVSALCGVRHVLAGAGHWPGRASRRRAWRRCTRGWPPWWPWGVS